MNTTYTPDAKSSVRTISARSFSQKLLEIVPIAPFLAFGLILAWSQLSLESVITLPASTGEPSLPSIRSISTFCNGLTLLACGLCVVFTKRFLLQKPLVITAGVVTGIASIIPLICADLGLSFLQAYGVMVSANAIRGIGSAILFIKVAELYGRISGRACIMNLGWCHVFASFVFFVVVAMAGYTIAGSANSALNWICLLLLPIITAFLSLLNPSENTIRHHGDVVHSEDIHTLPSSFWRFVVVILVFSFVMSLSSFMWSSTTGFGSDPRITNLARIAVALALIWTALSFDAEKFHFGKAYVVIIVLSIGIVSVSPLSHGFFAGWGTLSSFAMLLFRMLHWLVLCLIVCQRSISSVLVFGIGAGAQALGASLGDILPTLVFGSQFDISIAPVVSVVCAVVVLLCSFVLFSEKEFDRLFSPTNPGSLEFVDLFGPILDQASHNGISDDEASCSPTTVKSCPAADGINLAMALNSQRDAAGASSIPSATGSDGAPSYTGSAGSSSAMGSDGATGSANAQSVPKQASAHMPEPSARFASPSSLTSSSNLASRGVLAGTSNPTVSSNTATLEASEVASDKAKRSFNEAVALCASRYSLSTREVDVFRYLAMGYNAQTIAEKLFISWNTVRGHSRNIYTKLDVHSRVEVMELVDSIRNEK